MGAPDHDHRRDDAAAAPPASHPYRAPAPTPADDSMRDIANAYREAVTEAHRIDWNRAPRLPR